MKGKIDWDTIIMLFISLSVLVMFTIAYLQYGAKPIPKPQTKIESTETITFNA